MLLKNTKMKYKYKIFLRQDLCKQDPEKLFFMKEI